MDEGQALWNDIQTAKTYKSLDKTKEKTQDNRQNKKYDKTQN